MGCGCGSRRSGAAERLREARARREQVLVERRAAQEKAVAKRRAKQDG